MVGAIGAIVFSQVQLTELTEQINTTTTALAEQESIAVQLEMQAAEKMNTDEIEAYARETLGMEKATEGQTTYISLAQEDAGTVVQENTPQTSLYRSGNRSCRSSHNAAHSE